MVDFPSITVYSTYDCKFYDNYRDGDIDEPLKKLKIPLILKVLKPIEAFNNYNETIYMFLKFEIEDFNQFITKYLKRNGAIVSNNNLKKNIFIKYINIIKYEKQMTKS